MRDSSVLLGQHKPCFVQLDCTVVSECVSTTALQVMWVCACFWLLWLGAMFFLLWVAVSLAIDQVSKTVEVT